jgi:hypothetical protein
MNCTAFGILFSKKNASLSFDFAKNKLKHTYAYIMAQFLQSMMRALVPDFSNVVCML